MQKKIKRYESLEALATVITIIQLVGTRLLRKRQKSQIRKETEKSRVSLTLKISEA